MSVLTDLIYSGAKSAAELAENAAAAALEKYGADAELAFPDTAYCFPAINAATGIQVRTVGDLTECIGVMKSLITEEESIGEALNAGLATALGAEIIEGLKYAAGAQPYENETGIGFVSDPIIRSLGVPLVTGDIPGVAVVIGKAQNAADAVGVIKDYQSKGILTFLVGGVIDQAAENSVKMGLEFRVIPLGYDVTAVIHAVTVAVRVAQIFGGIEPGSLAELLNYTKERVPAFVNTFGELDAITVSAGAGAIAMGFPVIVDQELGELQIEGALESCTDHALTVKKSLAARNIRIKVKELPIHAAFAAAFEGEIIRKKDVHVEFTSNKNPACELVIMRDTAEIEDHRITVIGEEIGAESGAQMALSMLVEVCGEKMQADFEPVIERRIHHWFNYMEGVMHTGQRNLIRVRVSNAAYENGVCLRDFAEVIYGEIMDEFGSVVDKCQVTLYTEPAEAKKLLDEMAMPRYAERDSRLASMSDESVGEFYTCILCQSFAPSHCCVVTPERLGLCGAVSWLDAKATKELTPTGPCQPISKIGCTDEVKGIYTEVNRIVAEATQGAVESVALYSILEDPMTSCGCFECICGIMPEANGVVIVNREYKGDTPTGMTFGELASLTGGGVQTPGFMGHGRHFISSKKFVSAEGGIARIVWMPRELKDDVAEKLNKTAKELLGIDRFTDMICDETIATESEHVLEFLAEVGHPALSMDELL